MCRPSSRLRLALQWRAIAVLSLLFAASQSCADIAPFTSDGCSAFPDGTPGQDELWLKCCVQHDRAYWRGGTADERLAADEALQACVAAVGQPEIAELMLAGVRVGGTPYLPTKFRWGYGWPFFRGYKALTPDERLQVEAAEK